MPGGQVRLAGGSLDEQYQSVATRFRRGTGPALRRGGPVRLLAKQSIMPTWLGRDPPGSRAIESVRGQLYDNRELCIADHAHRAGRAGLRE
jgi:hypothetical protein